MREICFILTGSRILRAYIGTQTRIPDARERWFAIWENRDEITEIVHTHPGGFLGFSDEDLTTMEAVEAATGIQFTWSIVTGRGILSRRGAVDQFREDSPWWLDLLRLSSFTQTNTNIETPCQPS